MSRMNTKHAGFTLIELLVVIAIIGLLTAILVPSISAARRAATRARAMSQIRDLDGAVKRYFAEYGKMPLPTGYNGVKTKELAAFVGAEQAGVIQVLIGQDPVLNPKMIVFLDLDPSSYGEKTIVGMHEKIIVDHEPYKDPWWDPNATSAHVYDYGILMDFNFDGIINSTDAGDIRAKVGVYSLGDPDKAYDIEKTPFKTW